MILVGFCDNLLIHPEKFSHKLAFAHLAVEAVGLHHGAVVDAVGTAQIGRHGSFVVEVCKAAIGIFGTGVKNGLGGLLDFGFLFFVWIRPREVVIDNGSAVTVITF